MKPVSYWFYPFELQRPVKTGLNPSFSSPWKFQILKDWRLDRGLSLLWSLKISVLIGLVSVLVRFFSSLETGPQSTISTPCINLKPYIVSSFYAGILPLGNTVWPPWQWLRSLWVLFIELVLYPVGIWPILPWLENINAVYICIQ